MVPTDIMKRQQTSEGNYLNPSMSYRYTCFFLCSHSYLVSATTYDLVGARVLTHAGMSNSIA